MKARTLLCLCALVFSPSVRAGQVALIHGTLIDPASQRVITDASVVIDGDRIVDAGRISITRPTTPPIDCKGKFILPGYIDTHIHFFQSADLFTRPDGADLNSVRPYKDEVAWVKGHVNDVFERYLRCGITSVVDVGGPFWNLPCAILPMQRPRRRASL